MGNKVTKTDFEWVGSDEPHATRRKEILKKYPEIKKLRGHDPRLKWIVTGMVLTQFVTICLMKDASWSIIFVVAYCFGGVINHILGLALHEIAHNLAFGHSKPMANRIFGMFANLPLGIPLSISFKKYHLEHHRYQGDEIWDTDIPTYIEAKLFNTTLTKIFWVILQPFFYTCRPLLVYPKPLTKLEIINILVQLTFNAILNYFLGFRVIVYMIGGTLLTMGLHPIAGHSVAEHYMWKKGYETYSYYGPLNKITFNVGYHMEHHDFPNIPGSKLPEVNRIAKEFYDDLPHHTSWVKVIYDFITDPEIGPYSRVLRKHVEAATINGKSHEN